MLSRIASIVRRRAFAASLAALASIASAPVAAQITEVDPNAGIDADLEPGWQEPSGQLPPVDQGQNQGAPWQVDGQDNSGSRYDAQQEWDTQAPEQQQDWNNQAASPGDNGSTYDETVAASKQNSGTIATQTVDPVTTYKEDDLIGAAEGLFGKGAEGLARIIEDVLKKQGEPNGYIVGREGGGAFIVGLRYGAGTLFHKIEGNMPVYWTGPSIGLDAGANAGNTFVLVYNLEDTDELYERYPAGEAQGYFVGGFTASYLRKGNVVLIPIRVGAGLRLGINAGYMKFSKEQKWLPF